MIDLSLAARGELNGDRSLCELYVAAWQQRFTGGILLKQEKDAAIFFKDGAPIHAAGAAFSEHFLGELLVEVAACTREHVEQAVAEQQALAQPRPLLGSLLLKNHGIDTNTVKRAVQRQTEARLSLLFTRRGGSWQSAPGINARIAEIGVAVDPGELLLLALRSQVSDEELRAASDALLGKSVQLASGVPAGLPLDANEQRLLKLLDRPRKPDQLERAVGRRPARAFLRLLGLLGKLTTQPAAKAIPIAGATLLKGQALPAPGLTEPEPPAPDPTPPPPPVAPPRPAPVSKVSAEERALLAEVKKTHASLAETNHFDLLGVKTDTPQADIRKSYTNLAKRWHPDAFPGGLSDADAITVREVSARLNEAYATLSNDKTHAEYLALLKDERIRGDSRRAERVRDAEVKHQMGLVMLRKKDFQAARELFNYSLEADPEGGEYKSHLAWAMLADAKFDREEAIRKGQPLLQEALRQPRPSAATHYFMGELQLAKGQTKEAQFHFKRAAALDPKHADAVRQLRLLEMRAGKDDDDEEGPFKSITKLFKK